MNAHLPSRFRFFLAIAICMASLPFVACESTSATKSNSDSPTPVGKGDKYVFEGTGHVHLKIRTRNTREELFDGYLINRLSKTFYSEEPLYVAANPMENVIISVNDTPHEVTAKGLTAVVIKP